ncbi:MAG: DUF190 domain-containing protein [Methanobacteriota archaeon]|nr:MAG: DUF190 domain-containing protein [Euryarchaeota archaeon]
MELRKMLRVIIRLPGGKKSKGSHSLVKEVLKLCKEEGIIGATVIQSIYGYGDKDYEISILRGIGDLPQVIEIVDEPIVIRTLLPKLKELIESTGLITIDEVYSI